MKDKVCFENPKTNRFKNYDKMSVYRLGHLSISYVNVVVTLV